MEASRYNLDWKSDFLAALQIRDAREQVHSEIIQAYTTLAARLQNPPGDSTPTQSTVAASDPSTATSEAALRADLSKAQALCSTLTSEVASLRSRLASLESTTTSQAAQIQELTEDLTYANRKVKDLTEESRISRKLYQDCQDEMLAQQIQINMAEQRAERMKEENEMLVARWMKEKGREADEMNRAFEQVDLN